SVHGIRPKVGRLVPPGHCTPGLPVAFPAYIFRTTPADHEETAMQQAVRKTAEPLALKDPKLFRQQCYINGKWADADSKRTVDVNNPATNEVLGAVPYMGATETRRAIEAANAAWPAWRKKTAKERANILRKWFNLMMENQEDLATLMTAEQGKPLAESKGEIA